MRGEQRSGEEGVEMKPLRASTAPGVPALFIHHGTPEVQQTADVFLKLPHKTTTRSENMLSIQHKQIRMGIKTIKLKNEYN